MGSEIPMVGVCPEETWIIGNPSDSQSGECNSEALRSIAGADDSSWIPSWQSYIPQLNGGVFAPAAESQSGNRANWQSENVYPSAGIDKLEISHPAGAVRIVAQDTNQITVKAGKVSGGSQCYTEARREGSSFVLDSSHQSFWNDDNNCRIDMEIIVPQAMALDAEMGFVNLTLEGVSADIAVKQGSGTIYGNISSRSFDLELGQGVANLTWDHSGSGGKIDLKVGAATVTMTFPRGTTAHSQLDTGLASVTNRLPDSLTPNFDINGELGFGKLILQSK